MGGMGGWGDAIPLAFKNPSPPLEPKIGDLQQNIFWLNQEKNSIYWWIFLYIFRFRSTSDPGCCCWGGKELLYMGFSKSPCMVLEKSKAEPLSIIFLSFYFKSPCMVWTPHSDSHILTKCEILMAGPSSLGSHSNFILGCDPLCSFKRERGGTPYSEIIV